MRSTKADERRIDEIVSKQIRLYRLARNLSQTELGRKLNVTFQQIQKYEKGTNSLASGRMRQLCDALGITPNDLFGIKSGAQDEIPKLSSHAYRLAFKVDRLDFSVRMAVGQLVDGLAASK